MKPLTKHLGLLAGMLLTVAACGGGPTKPRDPVPGPLNLRLTTPNGDDGAILFEVVGGTINSITQTTTTFRVASSAPGITPRRAIVSGNLVGGTIAQITVPDVNDVGNYSAAVREVAARSTYTLRDLQGYGIEVVKP